MSNKIVISPEMLNKMSKSAKEMLDNSNHSLKYILLQTGINEEELKNLLEIANDERTKVLEDGVYSDIYDKLTEFFDKEKLSGSYSEKPKDVFFEIHKNLRENIKLKNSEQEKMIKDKLGRNFDSLIDEERFVVSDYIVSKYNSDELQEKASLREALENKIIELEMIEEYGFNENGMDENGEIVFYDDRFSPEEERDSEQKCEVLKSEIAALKERIEYYKKRDEDYLNEYIDLNPGALPYSYSAKKENWNKNIERHNFTKPFRFNADQQRAILEAYYDKCTDDEGYLLPDYFGTGIRLLNIIDEEPVKVVTGNWKFHFIKRVEPWKSNDELSAYDWGEKLPDIDKDDPLYQTILLHKRVFFKDTLAEKTREISRRIKYSCAEARNGVFELLKDEYGFFIPKSDRVAEHYKTLSEYYDILAEQRSNVSDTKYSIGQIYRALYEIAAESNGKLSFSNELVEQAYTYTKFKPMHWILHIYIFNYLFKHKSLDDLILFIEEKNWEYDAKEKE